MTTRNPESWMNGIIGPDTILVDGEEITTKRKSINLVGAAEEDDPDNDRTNVTVSAADATGAAPGSVQLAGDLAGTGGTAAAPRVSGITGVAGACAVTATTFNHTGNEEQVQVEFQVNTRTPSNTPVQLLDYDTSSDRLYVVKGYVVAQSADLAELAYWNIDALCKNDSGTLTVVTAEPVTEEENTTSTPALALAANGDDIELTATGVSSVPIRWSGRLLVHEIISVPDL